MEPVKVTESTVGASRPTETLLQQHALILAERGVMRLEAEGARWSLLPGQAALVAAARPVMVSVPTRLRAVWLHMDPEQSSVVPAAVSVFDVSALARELVLAIRQNRFSADATHRMAHSLMDVALDLATGPSPCVLPAPKSVALAAAMRLAEGQLETLPAFGEIARETGQSPRSLTRRCTEELGMPWRDLVRRMRMVRAVEALATTDAPVAEIAVLVGYSALSGFNEAFRDLMGQSPSEFRAGHRDGSA